MDAVLYDYVGDFSYGENEWIKMAIILPTGQWYAPSAVINDALIHTCKKTCDVAEKVILAKKNLRKKCVNRDKM